MTGWSGACTGTGDCTVTMDAAKGVGATFAPIAYDLTVTTTGSGTVTSAPAGITCGADCTETYANGTAVTLTATAAAGSVFGGWSGACSGTGPCTVTMDAAQSVGATFGVSRKLTVTRSGSGTVTGPGINCGGGDCTENYANGTLVTLVATPAANYGFAGWSGACTGTGGCTLTMDAAKTVTATFTLLPKLTVARTGSGTVTGPAGITCGADCTEFYPTGTPVTLTATPAANYGFAGWSGACTGTGDCTLTMDAAKSVRATFTLLPKLTVTRSGSGTVTGARHQLHWGLHRVLPDRHPGHPDRDPGSRVGLYRLERGLHRNRRLYPDHGRGQDRHGDLRGAAHTDRHAQRQRHGDGTRHRLRRRLHRGLRQWHRGHADRDPGRRLGLFRLERGLHRERGLHGDDERGAERQGDLRALGIVAGRRPWPARRPGKRRPNPRAGESPARGCGPARPESSPTGASLGKALGPRRHR